MIRAFTRPLASMPGFALALSCVALALSRVALALSRVALALSRAALALSSVLLLQAIMLTGTALAHEQKPVIAKIRLLDDHVFQASVNVHLESLLPELLAPDAHADPMPTAERIPAADSTGFADNFESMYPDELASAFDQVKAQFLHLVAPVASGSFGTVVLTQVFVDLAIPATTNANGERRSTLLMTAHIPEGTRTLYWPWPEPLGDLQLSVEDQHERLLLTTIVRAGESSPELDLHDLGNHSAHQVFFDYLKAGFLHIVPLGLDHLLFIIGLVIISLRWQDLLKQISVFTLAHSLTLALGSTGVISVSPTYVEPFIALSIVYIAVENVRVKIVRPTRLLVVFIFGLLHGLGFALVLDAIGLRTSVFLTALLGFNIGVELGQLAVAAVCLGMIWLRFGRSADHDPESRTSAYRNQVVIPVSVVIGLIGLYWVFQRTGITTGW